LGFHFGSETIHEAHNQLGGQNDYKVFINIEVIIFMTYHLKLFLSSKTRLKFSVLIWYIYFIIFKAKKNSKLGGARNSFWADSEISLEGCPNLDLTLPIVGRGGP
jgi:hypothetical protein